MDKQREVIDYPPNYTELADAFPIHGKHVIFSYGAMIYNPNNIYVPQFIYIHEAVHGARQLGDVTGWWRHYIDDPEFRLHEEFLAHAAELKYRLGDAGNRHARREIMTQTAARLASPIYGPVVGKVKARQMLKALASA